MMPSYKPKMNLIFSLSFCFVVSACGIKAPQSNVYADNAPNSEPIDPIDDPYLEDFPIIIDDGAELVPVPEKPDEGSNNPSKVDKNCPDAISNIVACVKPWLENAPHRSVTICRLDQSGACSVDQRSLTSFDSDDGKVKFDGITWKSCEKSPKYQILRREDGKTDSEVVTLHPGDVVTGLLCKP